MTQLLTLEDRDAALVDSPAHPTRPVPLDPTLDINESQEYIGHEIFQWSFWWESFISPNNT